MAVDNLLKLIEHQKSGFTLDREFYLNDEIFRVEMDKIWGQLWLFAGTTASIKSPGDFFTYKLGNENIIIVRGNLGEVYAHHNTCRHRGSLVCLEDNGNTSRFICPYHQWVFDKDGRLLRARHMPEDFCKEEHGLHKVHCEVIEGFIFISLAIEAPPIEKLKRDFKPYLSPFKMNEAKVAHTARYTLKTNWKLVAENFRECYHCGPAHPEYCGAVIGANMMESAEQTAAFQKPIWESKGLAVDTIPFANDTHHFAIRYPLRPGVKSYSLDGKEVSLPMGDHKDHDAGVLGMVVYPNFWMDAVSDYIWTMRLTAVSPSCTIIDLAWLVDKKAVEGLDYTIDRLTEFWRITGEQDWQLCENNFAGIKSKAYSIGQYSPMEKDVVDYIEWYLKKMKE
jgi:phenylpropionate dioxygenase-like ring-hydroxylating dioxygenase large terminal subunit